MANLVSDIALGKTIEFHDRVNNSDPTNAVLVLMVLTHSGLEADSVLRAYSTFSAILAASNNEVTNTGYSRIILTDANIAGSSVDTTFHRTTVTFSDQTFATISAGDSWSKLVIGYDSDSTGGTDANIIPVSFYDLRIDGVPVVPNGNNIIISAPNGYIVAS